MSDRLKPGDKPSTMSAGVASVLAALHLPPTAEHARLAKRTGFCLTCACEIDGWRSRCEGCLAAIELHAEDRDLVAAAHRVPHKLRWATFAALREALKTGFTGDPLGVPRDGAKDGENGQQGPRTPFTCSEAVERAWNLTKAWVVGQDAPVVVILWGNTRAGKSAIAAASAQGILAAARPTGRFVPTPENIERAKGFRWINAIALGEARREAGLGATPKLIRDAQKAPFLVIEEIGRESWQHEDRETIFRVLQTRMGLDDGGDAKPTIITTGKTPDFLSRFYDAGLWARMSDPNFSEVLHVTGGLDSNKGNRSQSK